MEEPFINKTIPSSEAVFTDPKEFGSDTVWHIVQKELFNNLFLTVQHILEDLSNSIYALLQQARAAGQLRPQGAPSYRVAVSMDSRKPRTSRTRSTSNNQEQ